MSIAAFGRICHSKLVLASSQAIVFNDGTANRTATIAAGSYFVRGDGTSSDLLDVIATAMNAAPSSSITDFTCSQNLTRGSADLGKITIASAGASSFDIEWTNGGTTFDGSYLGFATGADDTGGSSYTSDSQAKGLWFPEREGQLEDHDPVRRNVSSVALSSAHHTLNLGSWERVSVLFEAVERSRIKTTYASTNVAMQEHAFADLVDGGDYLYFPDNDDTSVVHHLRLAQLGGVRRLGDIAQRRQDTAPETYDVQLTGITYQSV